MERMYNQKVNKMWFNYRMSRWSQLFISWLISLVATLGSLFFSEVMGFPPCILCWYQRICMYPLVLIFFTSLFDQNSTVIRYTLSLSILGWIIAAYHNLIYWGVIPENLSPCQAGLSCADVNIEWLGFITIPFLSLTAFTLINIISFLILRNKEA